MKPDFKRLMQIGIIVKNIEESVKKYEEIGIGPWDVNVIDNTKPRFEDLTFNGEPIAEKGPVIKTAMITIYGLELELIEPVADTVFKRWLDEHGPGLHHLAFDTETKYDDLIAKTKEETGKDPWVKGYGFGGKMDFSYLDRRDDLGLIVECYKDLIPGKPAIPFDIIGDIVK